MNPDRTPKLGESDYTLVAALQQQQGQNRPPKKVDVNIGHFQAS